MATEPSQIEPAVTTDLGRVGDYVLLQRIGAGGMAEVFRARRSGPDGFQKIVVVKTILPAYSSNEAFVDMLIKEAKVSAALHHSNLVQVYDLGTEEGRPFIAMEYVDGLDLLQLLKECARKKVRLPVELVLYIIAEVAKGLDYAHHARNDEGQLLNIIHRDISPSNVLLSREGEVKITDFGVARFSVERGPVTRAGVLKGKMGYMSPEQVKGGLFDGRSDLFALGVVLFESLTLKRLFLGENELETLINIRDVKVEDRLRRHHAAVEPVLDILGKALHRSPDERFQRGNEFHRALMDRIFELGKRVDAQDLAEHVQEVMRELEEDPEAQETRRRELMTAQEIQEEMTVPGAGKEPSIGPEPTDILGPFSAAVVTQVEIPPDLRAARQTDSHAVESDYWSEWNPLPATEGEIISSSIQVAQALVFCVHQRLTGVFTLQDGESGVELFFAGGVVRTIHRSDGIHPLKLYLMDEKLITEETWAGIEDSAIEKNLRLMDAAIQHGRWTAGELLRHLQVAFERAFLSAFAWEEGTMAFDPEMRLSSSNRVPVELDAAELVTNGIAACMNEGSQEKWLDEHEQYAIHFHPRGDRLRHLGHREKKLLEALRSLPGTLGERVAGRSKSDRRLLARVLFATEAAGLVRFMEISEDAN